ncbi:MAG: PHP domain-containing protein, partial [Candidatus Bathyarchaeota archaeon]
MKRRFINPFKVKGDWFKGNVHTHSVNSDGTKTPEELIGIYRGAGYDFLSITDHSIVLDITGLDGKGLLLVPGGEMCIGRSEAGQFYHLVALGVEDLPFKDFDYGLDPQEVIDHTNAVGGIPIIAHPYWSGLNHGDLMKLRDYHGAATAPARRRLRPYP